MQDSQKVLIVGGGVIGLCSGYFLAKAGYHVVIVDRDPSMSETCSNRNAGMIVPSHFIPLAAPGVVTQGLKWMLNRRSPFYLRPRLDLKLWKWCWQFLKHSTRKHVENSQGLLKDLSFESRSLFEGLSEELDFELVEKGLLMLCQSAGGLEDETEVAEAAKRLGIAAEVCGPERLRELDPDVEMNAIGGVWFPRDAHLDSEKFLLALRRGIESHGGEIRNGEVSSFQTQDGRISHGVLSDDDRIAADHFVIAGGAWSPDLSAKLGLSLPMQGGKGYSFTLKNPTQLPQLCSLLKEGRVAVTPMGDTLRVAGTMEICGNDLSIDRIRLEGIVESFCRFFPAFTQDEFSGLEPWSGLRPCSPDGLPYIGKVPRFENAIVASGHSMLGLSLAPVTARIVKSLLEEETSDSRIDPARFS